MGHAGTPEIPVVTLLVSLVNNYSRNGPESGIFTFTLEKQIEKIVFSKFSNRMTL
jgi:hypothetical protein